MRSSRCTSVVALLPLLCSALHLPGRPPHAGPTGPSASRRQLLLGLGAAVAGAQPAAASPALSGYDTAGAATRPEAGRLYFPTLTPPLFNRATYRYDLGRDCWALEQLLTFANVSATIRSTVVKLKDGTLWVNSPQWPTGELCALLDELGPVGHIVLPCNALVALALTLTLALTRTLTLTLALTLTLRWPTYLAACPSSP